MISLLAALTESRDFEETDLNGSDGYIGFPRNVVTSVYEAAAYWNELLSY